MTQSKTIMLYKTIRLALSLGGMALCSLFVLQAQSITPQRDAGKDYDLEMLLPGGRTFNAFYPEHVPGLGWYGGRVAQVKDDRCILYQPGYRGEGLEGLAKAFVDNAQVAGRIEPGVEHQGVKPQVIHTDKGARLLYTLSQGMYVYNPDTHEVEASFSRAFGQNALDIAPNAKAAVVVKDFNLYLLPLGKEQTPRPISNDGSESLIYGQPVHQNEFGINKGTFWSPDGSKLAFYRMDCSMVSPYPLVDIQTRKAEYRPLRYPMAGMPSHHVRVGVYDLASGATTYIQSGGDPEHYLTNLSWSPDARTLYIAEVNRDQNRCDLNAYSVADGMRIATLFSEVDDKYVEPQHPLYFIPGKEDLFVWQSRRDGFNHLYLYNIQGKLIRQLTKGEWEVLDFKGIDPKRNVVYYESNQPSPIDRQLFVVSIKGGKPSCLTPELGVHRTELSSDFRHFIDVLQSPSIPRLTRLCSSDGKRYRVLLNAPDPGKAYRMPEIELGTILAADGKTKLHYRLTKPMGYDSGRKFPAIVYVYGGPHAQLVTRSWNSSVGGWDIYMAQCGYAVFTVDSRGSANRGKAFEQVIHRRLGLNEMADQMKGVEFLKSLPWVDAERLGVHGWSYGGFMTTNLMLTYPGVFKVGVAGGPVMDWSMYEIMYGERYMDTPDQNPEGYRQANLCLRAGDLKGRLLLIHGDVDNVVLWQHGLQFVRACVSERTYPDYMVYPGHRHNVIGPDRVHLYTTITRYFTDYL